MYNAARVRIVKCTGHLAGQPKCILFLESAFAIDPLAERFAFDVRRDEIQQSLCLIGIQQRQDVRMRQLRGNLDLAQKSRAADHGRHFGAKYLDCDESIVLDASGEIHDGARTAAELSLDLVRTLDGASEKIAEAGHAVRPIPTK